MAEQCVVDHAVEQAKAERVTCLSAVNSIQLSVEINNSALVHYHHVNMAVSPRRIISFRIPSTTVYDL